MEYSLAGKRIFVTGSTGMIGSQVARRLLQEGAHVIALARSPVKAEPLKQQGAEVIIGDITNPASYQRVLPGCQVIFHFASLLNEFQPLQDYRLVNVEGTRCLAEAALAARVERFIHTSTIYVYGMCEGRDVDETWPLQKSSNFYSDTKMEAETVLRLMAEERGLPLVVVQPSQVYGPEDSNWTLEPIQMIRSGKMLLVNGGRGLIQPIYIDDCADGIIAAARKGRLGQAYIIGGSQAITFREYFGRLAQIAGKQRLPGVPGRLAYALAKSSEWLARTLHTRPIFTVTQVQVVQTDLTYSTRKAREELGFTPAIDLDEGMARVASKIR